MLFPLLGSIARMTLDGMKVFALAGFDNIGFAGTFAPFPLDSGVEIIGDGCLPASRERLSALKLMMSVVRVVQRIELLMDCEGVVG